MSKRAYIDHRDQEIHVSRSETFTLIPKEILDIENMGALEKMLYILLHSYDSDSGMTVNEYVKRKVNLLDDGEINICLAILQRRNIISYDDQKAITILPTSEWRMGEVNDNEQ